MGLLCPRGLRDLSEDGFQSDKRLFQRDDPIHWKMVLFTCNQRFSILFFIAAWIRSPMEIGDIFKPNNSICQPRPFLYNRVYTLNGTHHYSKFIKSRDDLKLAETIISTGFMVSFEDQKERDRKSLELILKVPSPAWKEIGCAWNSVESNFPNGVLSLTTGGHWVKDRPTFTLVSWVSDHFIIEDTKSKQCRIFWFAFGSGREAVGKM